jgi:hypothetical protein
MNHQQPIKTAVQRIIPPTLPPKLVIQSGEGKTLTKPGPFERVEKFLKGKCFHCVYRDGTRFRAGQIIELVESSWCLVRYYSLKDGKLQPWQHLVRVFGEASSVESLDGFWIHESETDLDAAYRNFLQAHLEERMELAGAAKNEQEKE